MFNGQNLLTGTLAGSLDVASELTVGDQLNGTGGNSAITKIDVAGAKAQAYTLTASGATGLTLTGADGLAQTITVNPIAASSGGTLDFSTLGVKIELVTDAGGKTAAGIVTDITAAAFDTFTVTGTGAASLQVGANAGDQLSISFTNMQTNMLGAGSDLNTLITDDQNVSTIAKASALITELDGAIEDVNSQRGQLGAVQNRLESVVKSLSVAVENLSAAESRIRDADIASLSSELVSQQILQQAGISVLSQANSAPQAALHLLQQ